MSCTFEGGISFAYLLSLLIGLVALLLPLWATVKFERVRSITVVKEVDSGLFKDHSNFYMKDDSIPEVPDDPFPDFSETYIDPDVATTVKNLMITGLSILSLGFLHSIYRCCCHSDKASGMTSAIVYLVISLLTIVSGCFVISCPFTYQNHALADNKPEKICLGASLWMALASAILILLVGLVTFIHSLYKLCEAKPESQSEPRGKQKKVFTVF